MQNNSNNIVCQREREGGGGGGDRQTDRGRDRERQTDSQPERHRERQIDRQRQIHPRERRSLLRNAFVAQSSVTAPLFPSSRQATGAHTTLVCRPLTTAQSGRRHRSRKRITAAATATHGSTRLRNVGTITTSCTSAFLCFFRVSRSVPVVLGNQCSFPVIESTFWPCSGYF